MGIDAPDLRIQVGDRGAFDGIPFTVISQFLMSNVEEGETYFWHEWELKDDQGNIRILEHDEGDWLLTEAFVPAKPLTIPELQALTVGSKVEFSDSESARVALVSRATIAQVDGTPSWDAKRGDEADYVDLKSFSRSYVIEWADGEIEWFRQVHLSRKQVGEAFPELQARFDAERQDRWESLRPKRFLCMASFAAALLCALLWFRGLYQGETATHGASSIAQVPAEGLLFGPVTLGPGGNVHRLIVRASLSNASAWASAVLETDDQSEVAAKGEEMWDETGHDYEGAWHEYKLSGASDFNIYNTASYYVRLYAEPDNAAAQQGSVEFRLLRNAVHTEYLALYGVAMFLLFFATYQEQQR